MKLDKKKLEIAMARTQSDFNTLAKKTGIPATTIYSLYKREACKPSTAGRIASALNIDVTEIIE